MYKFTKQSLSSSSHNTKYTASIVQSCIDDLLKRTNRQVLLKQKGKNESIKKVMKLAESNVMLCQPSSKIEYNNIQSLEQQEKPGFLQNSKIVDPTSIQKIENKQIMPTMKKSKQKKPSKIKNIPELKHSSSKKVKTNLKVGKENDKDLKELDLKKDNFSLPSITDVKLDREIQVLRERKIETQQRNSLKVEKCSSKKNPKLKKISEYLSPCQIIAEVRKDHQIINHHLHFSNNKICKKSVQIKNSRQKLLSVPLENIEGQKSAYGYLQKRDSKIRKGIKLPPLK